jgi:hypothetical protein
MNTPDNCFDKIFVINLERRTDRWAQATEQLIKNGITRAERFIGHDSPVNHEGRVSANMGCTASHRGLLELIAHYRWPKVLILEDDALFLDWFVPRFSDAMTYIPQQWDMLFLGGSYAENPHSRYNAWWIRTNGLMTTSSYVITAEMARKMAPHISGDVGIDSLYHKFQRENLCYMSTPRLIVQRPSYSDIQGRDCDNSMSMLDSRHEEMLLEGRWVDSFNGMRAFRSEIPWREIAAPNDKDGDTVIVGDEEFKIAAIQLPKHKAPWYRGESVTFLLTPCI